MDDQVSCPYCGFKLPITEISSSREREAGLVYLRLRCVQCDMTVVSAGVGRAEALRDLSAKVKKREDNRDKGPEHYRIKPRSKWTRRR